MLITTLDTLEKEFKISFDFYGASKNGWAMVLRFMFGSGDSTYTKYGNRIPAVYYYSSLSKLRIYFDINGKTRNYQDVSPITIRKWHSIEIGQKRDGNSFVYSTKVNGKIEYNVINTDARMFSNVKVYASGPWYTSQPGFFKNLYVDTKGKCYYLRNM